MKVVRIVVIAVAAVAIGIAAWFGYKHWQERTPAAPPQTAAVEKKAEPEPESGAADLTVTPDPESAQVEALRTELRRLALDKNWAALEMRAEEMRTKKERFPGGAMKIGVFYNSLNPYREITPWVELTRQWVADRPESITARVAHAEALVAYAWTARGSAVAEKVSPEAFQLFKAQLDEAWGVLEKAKALPAKDPVWWRAALTAGLGLGFKREQYDQLFAEAVAFEPGFFDYYLQRARYLLPRWYGQPGEWERFAEEAATKEGGPGKEIYARIVSDLARTHKDLFGETAASWKLTQEGFEEMLQRYPESLHWPSMYCLFAWRNNDRETARRMFEKLDKRVDLSAWGEVEKFAKCREWAISGA